jgi:hypothetical protein
MKRLSFPQGIVGLILIVFGAFMWWGFLAAMGVDLLP